MPGGRGRAAPTPHHSCPFRFNERGASKRSATSGVCPGAGQGQHQPTAISQSAAHKTHYATIERGMTTTLHTQSTDNGKIDTEEDRRALLDDLQKKIEAHSENWKTAFLETIAAWPIENERIFDETFHYFIGGEAFNWKRLAERIATQLDREESNTIPAEKIFEWIEASNVFGGIPEDEFRRILGIDGWRAHLNHFYGVHIEQCLIAAVQARIQKNRYASGMPPSDDASDKAYIGLYEQTEQELWEIFTTENAERLSNLIAESPEQTRTIALDEEFTYWLFKRRIEYTLAPQVAAETQRGLDMMAKINAATERRTRMLKDQDGNTLLEFGLIKPKHAPFVKRKRRERA